MGALRPVTSLLAGALFLAACTATGGPGSTAPPATEGPRPGPAARGATVDEVATVAEAEDVDAGVVRMQGCEPRSLLPADVATRCGREVVGGLFSQLVELDPANAAPRWGSADDTAVAAEVASVDARRWEVELEEGWEFHDGSPVTAQSFVDAWNFGAYGPHGQAGAFLFEPITGFDELHCPEPGCEPTTDELEGLRAVDEMTLEIVLDAPDRNFPRRLGHVAFSPLPPSALEDPDAFAEAPVGNGPFRMEGPWQHEERIALRVVEDHPVAVSEDLVGVDFVLHDDAESAWQDLVAGRLDVADALPPARLANARRLFDRVIRDGDDIEALVVPSHVPALDDDRLAQALSRAIDRQAVIDQQLDGAARPARGLVPPVVSDEADRCGRTCRFDPDAARALLARAGFPPDGITLWFDRDGDNEPWVRAIAQQWRRHLRLEPQQVRVRSLPHTSWVAHLQDRRIHGLYPIGWSMDVASPHEYLQELHGPGGLFNFDRYSARGTAERLRAAAAARTERDSRLTLRRLEQDLLADMHHIPLWTRTHTVFHTERVSGVALDGKGRVILTGLEVLDPQE